MCNDRLNFFQGKNFEFEKILKPNLGKYLWIITIYLNRGLLGGGGEWTNSNK